MKKISRWSRTNVKKARALIVLIKLTLLALAYYTGISLFKMQVSLPVDIIYPVIAVLTGLAVFLYPTRKSVSLSKKWLYLKQKTCDYTLAACSFAMITTLVNSPDTLFDSSLTSYGSSRPVIHPPTAAEIINSLKTRSKESLTRPEKRILKKEFFKQLKTYAIAKLTGDKEKSGEAMKIFLVILGAVGLIYLLSALVCNLSCSGSDTAAVIAGLAGLAAIIWLVVVLIKRIKRGQKTKIEI